jgi:group II intron reverse transcriptase/maturase
MEDAGIANMLTTPEDIRTLQRKLYVKAKSEPAYRFYALYDKVYRADILSQAYALCRAHGGGAGIDGVSFEAIEAHEGVAAFLAQLQEALKGKKYQAEAVKRVMIPKADGSQRALGIPTVRDRVVQRAVKLVIEPIFEADFCNCSYGFRPKRSAHEAVDDVAQALHTGHTRVIDADLAKYFDTIPHAKLMKTVSQRIADGAILHLIQMWLKAPVIERDGRGKKRVIGGGKGKRRGTPQGGVISPLLANIYLHLLDRIWERHAVEEQCGARLVRYADDVVVLCKRGTARPLALIGQVLARLGLALNENKTRVVNAWQESFEFLGFELRMRKSHNTGRSYPHVQPAKKSMKKIKARLTQLTVRRNTPIPLEVIVGKFNLVLQGWVNYFHYRNCSQSLFDLKSHAEQRLRTHLCKRHRLKERAAGYQRFSNRVLYRHYRLYRVPTTAGWTSAHALR